MNRTYLLVVASFAAVAAGACRPAGFRSQQVKTTAACHGTRYLEVDNGAGTAVDVYTRVDSPILVGPAAAGKSRIPLSGAAALMGDASYYALFSHTTPMTQCTGNCAAVNGNRPRNVSFMMRFDETE